MARPILFKLGILIGRRRYPSWGVSLRGKSNRRALDSIRYAPCTSETGRVSVVWLENASILFCCCLFILWKFVQCCFCMPTVHNSFNSIHFNGFFVNNGDDQNVFTRFLNYFTYKKLSGWLVENVHNWYIKKIDKWNKNLHS